MKPGLRPGAMPRAKAGDFDNALRLAVTFGSKDSVRQGLTELRDAKVAVDTAIEQAEAAEGRAKERETVAQAAEAAAAAERQTLADSTAKASAALDKRTSAVTAREQAADAADRKLTERAADVDKRIGLLRAAGVTLPE